MSRCVTSLAQEPTTQCSIILAARSLHARPGQHQVQIGTRPTTFGDTLYNVSEPTEKTTVVDEECKPGDDRDSPTLSRPAYHANLPVPSELRDGR